MTSAPVCRLGVLLSGRGSNFAAIQQAITNGCLPQATVSIVIANHADAPGLALATSLGLPALALDIQAFPDRAAFDRAIVAALQAHQADLVILAGYDRIIGAPLLQAYAQRILNIHPSLLPAYGGKGMVGHKVHQAVLDNREAQSGCSVHVVTETVDGGPVLGQASVPVLAEDTVETLAARVLAQEHQLYPRVIGEWIEASLYKRGPASHESTGFGQDALV